MMLSYPQKLPISYPKHLIQRISMRLRSLKISGNDTTSAGWEALSKAVFDKTSLNSAADSNHTCMITKYNLD